MIKNPDRPSLGPTDVTVLEILTEFRVWMYARQIIAQGASKWSVYRSLRNLCDGGFIEWRPDTIDGRHQYQISAEGEKLFNLWRSNPPWWGRWFMGYGKK